jgi:hypothetical protein
MTQLLIMPDQQTAYARNEKAYADDTALKGGTLMESYATRFLWSMLPHEDGRIALWMNEYDDPSLTTEEEKAAMVNDDEARAMGFAIP